MYNILQKYFSSLVFLTKILIIAGAYYMISDKLLNDISFNRVLWLEEIESKGYMGFSLILLLLFFTLINWLFEILKWQSLVFSSTAISFFEAARQSLASLTASLITPNRIGEYGAKALYFSKSQRPKIMMLNFVGNISQMLVTVIFGLLGLFILKEQFSYKMIDSPPFFGIAIVLVVLVLLIVLFQKKWLARIHHTFNDLLKIPVPVLKRTFLYSIIRYLVFSHQFYLILVFFGIDLEYSIAMSVIFSMYLISSVIPGFVLFDWLVKGSVAVSLFSLFGVDEMIVLSITATMWILNFALPAAIGSFYVLTFKTDSLVLSESKILK